MNGYISIKLGGENRGIKFGNRALLDIMAKHQVSEGLKFSFDLVVDIVYFGLVNCCMIKKENVDFTEEQVTEWVDDLAMPLLLDIFNTFKKSYEGEAVTVTGAKKINTSAANKKK